MSILLFILGVIVGISTMFFVGKNNKAKVLQAEKVADDLKDQLEKLKDSIKKK